MSMLTLPKRYWYESLEKKILNEFTKETEKEKKRNDFPKGQKSQQRSQGKPWQGRFIYTAPSYTAGIQSALQM